MEEPYLVVPSALARDLAHRLARRESCMIADVVERALIAYERRQGGEEAAFATQRPTSRIEKVDLSGAVCEPLAEESIEAFQNQPSTYWSEDADHRAAMTHEQTRAGSTVRRGMVVEFASIPVKYPR